MVLCYGNPRKTITTALLEFELGICFVLLGYLGAIRCGWISLGILCITLQASTKSKLRATHVHHGQVLNILRDISNTGKRTIHNNTSKQESYINNQHHVTTWTDTVGSPHSSPLRMTAVGPRGQSSGRPLNQWEVFHGRAHRRCGWQPHSDGQLRNNTAERLWPSG